jgi:hypothetical protein
MMMNLIGDRAGGLHGKWSLNVVLSPVSIKDRTVVRPVWFETLQLATYSGKPDTSTIPLWERTTAHWEWRDSESSVYPPYESEMDGSI